MNTSSRMVTHTITAPRRACPRTPHDWTTFRSIVPFPCGPIHASESNERVRYRPRLNDVGSEDVLVKYRKRKPARHPDPHPAASVPEAFRLHPMSPVGDDSSPTANVARR